MTEELFFLIEIIKNATKISEKEFDVQSKGNENDLVTTLDLEIEKYLITEIKSEYPDFDIVSEEFNNDNFRTKNCFIIDPIDGTINFANGIPLWGIQVACIKDGEMVASVINLPQLKEFYYADKNGAYCNGKKISVKQVPIKKALYSIDGDGSTLITHEMSKHARNIRNYGALCISLVFVASGRIHGSVFTKNQLWDYMPGLYLCKMAGAIIKDYDGFHAVAMNEEFMELLEKETVSNKAFNN